MNQENHRNKSTPWNKGKLISQKSPPKIERNLGHSHSFADGQQHP